MKEGNIDRNRAVSKDAYNPLMTKLIVGLVIFLGVHTVAIVAPNWRDRMAARMGEWPWKGLYSVISIVGFVLIIWGYGEARQSAAVLYTPPPPLRYVAALLMVPVFPLLFAAYLPGRIKAATKHPMLIATILWALAHLLANGTVADVLLFGGFLAWAIADRASFARRPQRPIRTLPGTPLNDVIAVVGGLAVYAAFVFWLHLRWFGVPVLV
jgi:uncharacterized membrane protein